MLDFFKDLIDRQYQASLCTLNLCIDRCTEEAWNAPVSKLAFCQAAFHCLVFTDLYLGPDPDSIRQQPFHLENQHVFRDYEEFEDREPQCRYEKGWIKTYLEHCRAKASQVLAAETAESLAGPSGFHWLKFPRAELHVYNIRHIQHHAAQLILRLRLDGCEEIPWFGSGWREMPDHSH